MSTSLKLHQIRAFFNFPGFWVATIILFFVKEKGLSESFVYGAFAGYSLLALLLEIPTGVVADKYSRKLSVMLGYISSAIGFTSVLLIESSLSIYIFILFLALSMSLISGAQESMLYDTVDELGQSTKYKKYASRFGMISLLTAGLYTYIGGVLAEVNLAYPMIISTVFYMISAVLTMLMKEPEVSARARQMNDNSLYKHLVSSLKVVINKKNLGNGFLIVLLIYSLFVGFQTSFKYIIPTILESLNTQISIIGIVSSVSLICLGLGAFVVLDLFGNDKLKSKSSLVVITLIVAFVVMLFTQSRLIASIAISLISFSAPVISTIADQFTQDFIQTSERATVLSIRNIIVKGFAGVLVALFGVLIDHFTLQIAISFLSVWIFIGILLYLKVVKKLKIN